MEFLILEKKTSLAAYQMLKYLSIYIPRQDTNDYSFCLIQVRILQCYQSILQNG